MLGSSIQISSSPGAFLPLSGGTLTGDLNIGANKLKLQAITLKDDAFGTFYVRNLLDTADAGFFAAIAYLTGALYLYGNGLSIAPQDVDNYYAKITARDNTVGQVEVARFSSAADPYFQIGRDDTGVATNAITDVLVIQCGAGTNNEAAGQGAGIPFKIGNAASEVEERASIDAVLVTATNGAEEAKLALNLMVAGAMVAEAQLESKGLTYLASVDSAAVADQATIGGFDLSAGNRSLSISTEHVPAVSVAIPSTHKVGVRWNGGTYYFLLSNV